MDKNKEPKQIRCAIYTRKSTNEGLDQEFSSLDAQRESGENYIRSQQSQGWVALPDKYDDGGFTGATIDRPALQKLLEDIKAKKADCVVGDELWILGGILGLEVSLTYGRKCFFKKAWPEPDLR